MLKHLLCGTGTLHATDCRLRLTRAVNEVKVTLDAPAFLLVSSLREF